MVLLADLLVQIASWWACLLGMLALGHLVFLDSLGHEYLVISGFLSNSSQPFYFQVKCGFYCGILEYLE